MVSIPRGQKEGWCFDDAVPLNWIMVVPLVGACSLWSRRQLRFVHRGTILFCARPFETKACEGVLGILAKLPPVFFPFRFWGLYVDSVRIRLSWSSRHGSTSLCVDVLFQVIVFGLSTCLFLLLRYSSSLQVHLRERE